jgi:hypothetical protein
MSNETRWTLDRWTADYGDGELEPVTVPHAWNQDVSVSFEGPVVYRTSLEVPKQACWLVFHGVSYAAEVKIGGEPVASHRGIWDAFSVPLKPFRGKTIHIEVAVVKNGGETYPVRDVASGFLPFVFHTFGGIHGEVEVVLSECDPVATAASAKHPPTRVSVDRHKILVDGKPFYARGLLTWGWYPELGHTNPPSETIRREVRAAKAMGFNLVKFCLWVPPHRYLEILKEEGMEAWLELPLWDPSPDPAHQEAIAEELERIVRQYRRHDNIVIWTVGCELSASTPPEYRQYLTTLVKNLTGCPLVKDNSGGAEMYGGDLREYGDFYDFHPYCDTNFYPLVLDTLLPAARKPMPILLGEFNDVDAHRDIAKLRHEMPYWGSTMRELNDQGVRWQHDLPNILVDSGFANDPVGHGHEALMEASRQKALFIRKTVQEAVRGRDAIGGYVITGWRDTPISTAGFFDDWDSPRFTPDECAPWNGEDALFLIPTRRPPWVNGGNRPGFLYSQAHFTGQVYWRVGVHSEGGCTGGLAWCVTDARGRTVARGASDFVAVPALEATEVGQIHWACEEPGDYTLTVEFGGALNSWPILVVRQPDWDGLEGWSLHDPAGLLSDLKLPGGPNIVATRVPADLAGTLASGANVLLLMSDEGTNPMPFWRESAYQFHDEAFWDRLGLAERWERFLPISSDRTIDADWLRALLPNGYEVTVLMNRIDARTYKEAPILVRATGPGRTLIATTLRPYGGLGAQPTSLAKNAVGSKLLADLLASYSSSP